MCGRFAFSLDLTALGEAFPWLEPVTELQSSYNIAPTQAVPVVPNDGSAAIKLFRWGLVPPWADDPSMGNRMINARAETLAEKPSFRNAFRRRRCLILAAGFFEWRKDKGGGKTPMFVRLKSGLPFAFAGLWERWSSKETGEELLSCTIVTCEPNPLIAEFHHRMPVILPPEVHLAWIDPRERQPQELAGLLAPYPAEEMEAYPVSKAVNNPRNNSPQCILPLE
jgi:putative SOS response-associated peptidase YedK